MVGSRSTFRWWCNSTTDFDSRAFMVMAPLLFLARISLREWCGGPAQAPRGALNRRPWTPGPPGGLGACKWSRSGPDLGEAPVGAEVDVLDGHGLEVREAVEAEQADGALLAVEQDQGDRVVARRSDRKRHLDGPVELLQRRLLQKAQHLDVLPGAERAQVALQAPAQEGEAHRQVPVRQGPGVVERAGLALEQRQVVEGVEEDLLLGPAPWMDGHHLGAHHEAHVV